MKAKIKNIKTAQKQGFGGVKKLLKNLLIEPIIEPQWFFYDNVFNYGKDLQQPILYIGEPITFWKNYAKKNKESKTFVAGSCTFDVDKNLKFLVKTGKGGKPAIIKEINKLLLKPFAKAILVESLDEKVVPKEEDSKAVFSLVNLEKEVNLLTQPATLALTQLNGVITILSKPLSNLKNTIVSDKLIQQVNEGLTEITKHSLPPLMDTLSEWLKDAQTKYEKQVEATPLLEQVSLLVNNLQQLVNPIDTIIKNGKKVQKVQNPSESAVPPISDDPMRNWATFLQKNNTSSPLSIELSNMSK